MEPTEASGLPALSTVRSISAMLRGLAHRLLPRSRGSARVHVGRRYVPARRWERLEAAPSLGGRPRLAPHRNLTGARQEPPPWVPCSLPTQWVDDAPETATGPPASRHRVGAAIRPVTTTSGPQIGGSRLKGLRAFFALGPLVNQGLDLCCFLPG